jgi:copper homeostasis protein (lipoprotein)
VQITNDIFNINKIQLFNQKQKMKKYLIILVLIVQIIGVTSCKSTKNTQTNAIKTTGDNSMTSVDWAGTYQGVLPCADCEGIQTQLVLNKDLSYVLETRYIGKDDKIFQTKGAFKWDSTGSRITLDGSNNQMYLVGENKLFHLDKDGNRITGNLENNYIMEKEIIEITGKYWKLVRLNGKQVEAGSREPFIRFTAKDSQVNGNSGCNSFNGKYELSEGNRIKFSPFAMTKMACMDSNVEEEFMQVIGKTTSYSMTSDELIFQDEYETTLAKFEADFFR